MTCLWPFQSDSDFVSQVFPLVAREDEGDVKSIRSHRIKMEISGLSLEESMEECRVEETSVHKVRCNICFQDSRTCNLHHGSPSGSQLFMMMMMMMMSYFFSFRSPTIRMSCRMTCRTLTWSWTHPSLTAEAPWWIPVTAPVTPAAPRVPCAPCLNGAMLIGTKSLTLLFVKRFSWSSQHWFLGQMPIESWFILPVFEKMFLQWRSDSFYRRIVSASTSLWC